MPDLEQNKETVRVFYDLAGDGPQPLIEFVTGFVAQFPDLSVESSGSSRRVTLS